MTTYNTIVVYYRKRSSLPELSVRSLAHQRDTAQEWSSPDCPIVAEFVEDEDIGDRQQLENAIAEATSRQALLGIPTREAIGGGEPLPNRLFYREEFLIIAEMGALPCRVE